jgi:hypothetical protein
LGYGVKRNRKQYFCYIVAVSLLVEEIGEPGENHRPAASHINFDKQHSDLPEGSIHI